MSRRYASYWNAFLFGKMFAKKCIKMKELGQRRGTLIPSVIPLGSANGNSYDRFALT